MEASGSLDTLGILARSVEDVALYRDVLLGIPPRADRDARPAAAHRAVPQPRLGPVRADDAHAGRGRGACGSRARGARITEFDAAGRLRAAQRRASLDLELRVRAHLHLGDREPLGRDQRHAARRPAERRHRGSFERYIAAKELARGVPHAARRALGRHRRAADAGGVRRGAGRHARRSRACRCSSSGPSCTCRRSRCRCSRDRTACRSARSLSPSATTTASCSPARNGPIEKLTVRNAMDIDATTEAPGRSPFPAICAGATPCRSSKAWCPMAPPRMAEIDNIRLRLKARAGEADLDKAWKEEWAPEADRVASLRRQGRRRGPQDHRRQPIHARRQLLLQRRALHPAGRREARDLSQGAALLPGRDGRGCIPTSSASRCPTRRA